MTYRAIYEQDETGAWNVTIADQPGVYTFGKTLVAARKYAREALALWLDVDAATLEVEDDVRLPARAQKAMGTAEKARAALERDQERLREAMADAARELVAAGLALRDAATVLGLSYQRVHQLTHA